jgi:hypothetical protein
MGRYPEVVVALWAHFQVPVNFLAVNYFLAGIAFDPEPFRDFDCFVLVFISFKPGHNL